MKQAVILIHGIGEQRPMQTLRRLVKCLSGKRRYYSKPDFLSVNFDLRVFSLSKDRKTPPTDFYELYWAHHVRGTEFYIIWDWMRLLFTKAGSARWKLKPFIYIFRALVISIITYPFLLAIGVTTLRPWSNIVTLFVLALLALYLTKWHEIFQTICKAAIYLNKAPFNIKNRNDVIKEGVELLKKLHGENKYERIIIIGHSLGSVIGYDIIRSYWNQVYNFDIKYSSAYDSKYIKRFKYGVQALNTAYISPVQFQECQFRLLSDLQVMGLNWKITDFVSIGSPLTHGRYLMVEKDEQFPELLRNRELSTCPPQNSHNNKEWRKCTFRIAHDEIRTFTLPTFDYAFSVVKWTNIFYDHRYCFWGDLIGGKISDVFGKGVRDISITPKFKDWLGCHTKYWLQEEPDSITCKIIRSTMNYEDGRSPSATRPESEYLLP